MSRLAAVLCVSCCLCAGLLFSRRASADDIAERVKERVGVIVVEIARRRPKTRRSRSVERRRVDDGAGSVGRAVDPVGPVIVDAAPVGPVDPVGPVIVDDAPVGRITLGDNAAAPLPAPQRIHADAQRSRGITDG